MISFRFQGKSFNITVIQVCTLTTDVQKAKVDRFYEDLQDLLGLTPKKDAVFIKKGLECKSRKYRDNQNNRKVWYKLCINSQ